MGGGGGGQKSTSTTEISPDFKPYIQYALGEAKNIYNSNPTLPSQMWVDPSAQTQQALQVATDRATAGSPLLKAAQQQNLSTINGDYLNGSPFFQGAFKAATESANNQYTDNVNAILSKASQAGRYGSSALGNVLDRANQTYANSLNNTAGTLAYNNYAAERAAQQNAMNNAPTMANADYNDINKLLQVGQAFEGYDQSKIQGMLAQADLPMKRLQQAAGIFYGAPLETTTTSTATPTGGK